jgi:glycosidase
MKMKRSKALKKLSYSVLSIPLLLSFSTGANADSIHSKVQTQSKNGVYYEVYVNSFYDSNHDGHGDLKGLTEKLNYLNDGNPKTNQDLGVNGIWLMPITASPSYHKYDVTDYYKVDPQYGNMDDLHKLVKEAHKRGIKVIMDLVINHTSSDHPWFQAASKDLNSKYHNYYVWANQNTDLNEKGSWGQQVWYKNPNGPGYFYSTFWSGMPDLNYDNPDVRKEMINVGKFWLKQGVDGFRLDAAMHIYPGQTQEGAAKNYQWWQEFQSAMKTENPNVYLAGEVWDKTETIAPYFKSIDSLFNFNIGSKIIDSINSGTDQGVASDDQSMQNLYKGYNQNEIDAPFLTNHDQNRVMSDLSGDINKAKVAASVLLTLPGNPFIYYGEELGMKGQKPDELIREPFRWYSTDRAGQTTWEKPVYNTDNSGVSVQEETKDPNSLLSHYRDMIRLREAHEALTEGNIEAIKVNNSHVIAFKRSSKQESLSIVHNISNQSVDVDLSGIASDNAKVIFSTTQGVKINHGFITVPAYTSVVIK